MIKIRNRNAGHEIDVRFPISESELYGLLIYNPFEKLTEVYDGQTFPEYYYQSTLASAEVSYNDRTELLLLPGEELAIKKALARLGALSDQDCEIKFSLQNRDDDASRTGDRGQKDIREIPRRRQPCHDSKRPQCR